MQKTPSHNIYLVRHAESEFNALVKPLRTQTDLEETNRAYAKFKFDATLVDCGLSLEGVAQAESLKSQVESMDLTAIYTSPLRRALETAVILAKNHKSNPKIIAVPYIREELSSSCDISLLENCRKDYPQIDFSLLDAFPVPALWIVEQMEASTRFELQKKLLNKEGDIKENFGRILTQELKNIYPERFENGFLLGTRVLSFKNFLKSLTEDNSSLISKNFIVVSHSRFLTSLTATKYDSNGKALDGRKFKNCESFEYKM